MDCSAQLQAVGSDILNRLVELLQLFNSRSCQLVLGAGAMHLSGLKSVKRPHDTHHCHCRYAALRIILIWLCCFFFMSFLSSSVSPVLQITATHLALSSQSVGLLVTQIPVLRQVLSQRLPSKHHILLHSLDRVSKDCQEHQKEIFMKLITIMADLIRGMVEKLRQQTWTKLDGGTNESRTTTTTTIDEADKVDECVKILMKQTCSLHRALSDLLLVDQRDGIFREISQRFLSTITEFVQTLQINKPIVKMKITYNVTHIVTRLVGETEAHNGKGKDGWVKDWLTLCVLLCSLGFEAVPASTRATSSSCPHTHYDIEQIVPILPYHCFPSLPISFFFSFVVSLVGFLFP